MLSELDNKENHSPVNTCNRSMVKTPVMKKAVSNLDSGIENKLLLETPDSSRNIQTSVINRPEINSVKLNKENFNFNFNSLNINQSNSKQNSFLKKINIEIHFV